LLRLADWVTRRELRRSGFPWWPSSWPSCWRRWPACSRRCGLPCRAAKSDVLRAVVTE